MEKVELPVGITLNGSKDLYTETQIKANTDVYRESINPNNTRKFRRPKNYIRPPGKLERVVDTKIYTEDERKKVIMSKYHMMFKTELMKRFPEHSMSEVLVCAFGADDEYKDRNDIYAILEKVNETHERISSNFQPSGFSHFLSAFWNGKKCIMIFVYRKKRDKPKKPGHTPFIYKMSEIGLKIGAPELIKIMNKKIPDNFDKLRLMLSDCRLAAKRQGVTENEFNEFLKARHSEILSEKETQSPEDTLNTEITDIATMEKEPQYKPAEIKSEEFYREPANQISEPAKETISSGKMPTKIHIDLKIWFIPVNGTIILED